MVVSPVVDCVSTSGPCAEARTRLLALRPRRAAAPHPARPGPRPPNPGALAVSSSNCFFCLSVRIPRISARRSACSFSIRDCISPRISCRRAAARLEDRADLLLLRRRQLELLREALVQRAGSHRSRSTGRPHAAGPHPAWRHSLRHPGTRWTQPASVERRGRPQQEPVEQDAARHADQHHDDHEGAEPGNRPSIVHCPVPPTPGPASRASPPGVPRWSCPDRARTGGVASLSPDKTHTSVAPVDSLDAPRRPRTSGRNLDAGGSHQDQRNGHRQRPLRPSPIDGAQPGRRVVGDKPGGHAGGESGRHGRICAMRQCAPHLAPPSRHARHPAQSAACASSNARSAGVRTPSSFRATSASAASHVSMGSLRGSRRMARIQSLPSQGVGEDRPQAPAPPRDARHHGADGHAQDLRDLLVVQAVDVSAVPPMPEVRRQPADARSMASR